MSVDPEDKKDWPWYYWLLLPFAWVAEKVFRN